MQSCRKTLHEFERQTHQMAKNTDHGDKSLENSSGHEFETSNGNTPEVENINHDEEFIKTDSRATDLAGTSVKKVRHYLFDFLMLFLAVFCGFIAENWRLQLSEHQREEEFVQSILEDIKSDTLESHLILMRLSSLSVGIDSVLTVLSSPEILENSNNAYRLWTANLGLEVFVSNDRTIQQLKNSGELRLIRNRAVSDKIMEYDQTLKQYSVQSNLMYNALGDMTNYSEIFDFISLNKNPDHPVPLTVKGKESLNRAYANLQLWDRGLTGLIGWLKVVNEEGKRLIAFIQKEYQIEAI